MKLLERLRIWKPQANFGALHQFRIHNGHEEETSEGKEGGAKEEGHREGETCRVNGFPPVDVPRLLPE
ncbi:MAG TPA: hypothetical protein VF483_01655 [Gemmatimonadaceae bacterium]